MNKMITVETIGLIHTMIQMQFSTMEKGFNRIIFVENTGKKT